MVKTVRFQENRHMKVVRLSAVRTGQLNSPGNIPGNYFCQRLSQPKGHSADGRIISIKNSNNTNGNRTCDLAACSAVPQPTAETVGTSPSCNGSVGTLLTLILLTWRIL